MRNYLLTIVSVLVCFSLASCLNDDDFSSDIIPPELSVFEIGNEGEIVAAGDTTFVRFSASDDQNLYELYLVFYSLYNDTVEVATTARIDTVSPRNVIISGALSGNSVSHTVSIPMPENSAAGYYIAKGAAFDAFGNRSSVKTISVTVTNSQAPTIGLLFPDDDEKITVKAQDSILLKGEAMDSEGLYLLEADLYFKEDQLVKRVSLVDSVKGMPSATFEKQFVISEKLEPGDYKLHVKAWDNDGGFGVSNFRLNANVTSRVIDVVVE